jgi:hypothetical protein
LSLSFVIFNLLLGYTFGLLPAKALVAEQWWRLGLGSESGFGSSIDQVLTIAWEMPKLK